MGKITSSKIPGGERVTIEGTGWTGKGTKDIDYIDGKAVTITDHDKNGKSTSYEAVEFLGGLITTRGDKK